MYWFVRAAVLIHLLIGGTCWRNETVLMPRQQTLAAGTWGGDGAGLIAQDSTAHVHIACTYGDFSLPVALDDDGRFNVHGSYVLRAYPVAVGPALPAQFAGVVRTNNLILSVAVQDTVEDRLVLLGPVSLRLGDEPRLGPCPICRSPAAADTQ